MKKKYYLSISSFTPLPILTHLIFCIQIIWKQLFRESHMISKIYSKSTPKLSISPSAPKYGEISIATMI